MLGAVSGLNLARNTRRVQRLLRMEGREKGGGRGQNLVGQLLDANFLELGEAAAAGLHDKVRPPRRLQPRRRLRRLLQRREGAPCRPAPRAPRGP